MEGRGKGEGVTEGEWRWREEGRKEEEGEEEGEGRYRVCEKMEEELERFGEVKDLREEQRNGSVDTQTTDIVHQYIHCTLYTYSAPKEKSKTSNFGNF